MKCYLLSLLLTLSLLLCACTKAAAYADNVPCAELADTATDQIPVNFGYETYGGEHLRYYFEDTELPDDTCLRYSVLSEDINELGIFHAPDETVRAELVRLTEDYLDRLLEEQSAFIAGYAPKELTKLEHAEVRTFGNYVVYAILDDNDRELVFETVEKELKE
ncbi:MAG: DUF4358 domain-containing protein [Ruminococcaceae bacterium]|nr:DUF4358 domain-containing protein [Oscillospiraceae bacterium]